LAISTKQRMWK